MSKSGYVAILGRPNVGKSSLLNAFVGQKVAIVTAKPQTTRTRILGIRTFAQGQILFLDTPGLHSARGRALNAALGRTARGTMEEADILLYMVEPEPRPEAEDLQNWTHLKTLKKPSWLIINKIDRVGQNLVAQLLDLYFKSFAPDEIFAISVLKNKGLDPLADEILKALPAGPPLYDAEEVTDQTERQLVAEMIREQAIQALQQELPYTLAVTIDDFKDRGNDSFADSLLPPDNPRARLGEADASLAISIVHATIHVERESQKGIVIGAGGEMLKTIGTRARLEIERQLGRHFFLKLFVRVTENWTDDPARLKELL